MKNLRSTLAKTGAKMTDRSSDALAGIGVTCLSAGTAMIYLPAGVIVLGVLLLAIAIGAER